MTWPKVYFNPGEMENILWTIVNDFVVNGQATKENFEDLGLDNEWRRIREWYNEGIDPEEREYWH